MKTVIAFVKPEMLDDVVYALHKIDGVRGASVCDGRGFGAWRLDETPETIQRESGNFRPHARIETICSDDIVAKVVEVISTSARTGIPGDGLVFTFDLETCIRIRTGQADDRIR